MMSYRERFYEFVTASVRLIDEPTQVRYSQFNRPTYLRYNIYLDRTSNFLNLRRIQGLDSKVKRIIPRKREFRFKGELD